MEMNRSYLIRIIISEFRHLSDLIKTRKIAHSSIEMNAMHLSHSYCIFFQITIMRCARCHSCGCSPFGVLLRMNARPASTSFTGKKARPSNIPVNMRMSSSCLYLLTSPNSWIFLQVDYNNQLHSLKTLCLFKTQYLPNPVDFRQLKLFTTMQCKTH